MWLLLLPPLVVIVSFSFLLWYLTKKQYDPAVQAEMLRMSTVESAPMLNFKTAFWTFLEKMMRRFKVVSLKLHNTLNDWSQSARQQKERNKRGIQLSETPQSRPESESVLQPERTVPRTDMTRSPEIVGDFLEIPIVRETRGETAAPLDTGETIPVRKANIEDVKKTKLGHEEDYISAIATNPKDFTAYEKLGDYYMDNGNIKDAKECYRQVLRLSPANTEVKMKIRRLEKILG